MDGRALGDVSIGAQMARRSRSRPPGADYEIRVVGVGRTPLRDFYHSLLRRSWPTTFAVVAAVFVAANALFAIAYLGTGGIAHAARGSFLQAFFFSVQTMGTIGYGTLYPESTPANTLVVAESVVGILLTAVFTGLVFAKFSRPTARVGFTREATISPMNGVATLAFRLGNQRGNRIVDAQIRVSMVRTERTLEGKTFYRMTDLPLARERILSLTRSWMVLHTIDEKSPLFGATPESLAADDVELEILVVGIDDTAMQPVHAGHRYFAPQILWGARHADVLSETPDGGMVLDLTRFDATEPTPPTPTFPYSDSGPRP